MSRRRASDLNYWPSVADMFLAGMLLLLVLWLGQTLLSVFQQAKFAASGSGGILINGEEEAKFLEWKEAGYPSPMAFTALEQENKLLVDRLAKAESELDRLRKQVIAQDDEILALNKRSRKPPIIHLREAEQFTFAPRSADPEPAFVRGLKAKYGEPANGIRTTLREFVEQIDTIEIIGHTDGARIINPASNLDAILPDALAPRRSGPRFIPPLNSGSNADLGLMRAVAVRNLLKPWLAADGLGSIQIRCFSAAQTEPLRPAAAAEDYEGTDNARRRIEVRFIGSHRPVE